MLSMPYLLYRFCFYIYSLHLFQFSYIIILYVKTYTGAKAVRRALIRYKQGKNGKLVAKMLCRRYLKQYRKKQRREQKRNRFVVNETFLDFSGEDIRNTAVLRQHCVTAQIAAKYEDNKDVLLCLRKACKPPLTKRSSSVAYKVLLAKKLNAAMTEQNLSSKSLSTCCLSKKATRNQFRSATETAALILAHRVYLQRQSCINKLKFCFYFLKDYAAALLAVMKMCKTEAEQKVALMGLQCHHR